MQSAAHTLREPAPAICLLVMHCCNKVDCRGGMKVVPMAHRFWRFGQSTSKAHAKSLQNFLVPLANFERLISFHAAMIGEASVQTYGGPACVGLVNQSQHQLALTWQSPISCMASLAISMPLLAFASCKILLPHGASPLYIHAA